jgi:copper/silver efflux system protein
MIDRLIEFSARNRFLVLLFVAAAALAGWWSLQSIPLDAIPDLSDTQVIVYSKWDRSPDIIEDQVTYPMVSAMLGAPRVKDVRGFSDFGYSYVYIIFEDGTDIYWARSRTLEYLSKIQSRLPQGVKTELGPDATGVGWVFQYALVDTTGRNNLAQLRSLQDWFLRYQLQAVPGVAEVAPLGGFVRQYQVNVDPNRLAGYGVPSTKWWRRCARQQRRRRAAGGIHRPRVHGARPRLRALGERPGATSRWASPRRACRSWCATWAR